jgi:hypothetical protein
VKKDEQKENRSIKGEEKISAMSAFLLAGLDATTSPTKKALRSNENKLRKLLGDNISPNEWASVIADLPSMIFEDVEGSIPINEALLMLCRLAAIEGGPEAIETTIGGMTLRRSLEPSPLPVRPRRPKAIAQVQAAVARALGGEEAPPAAIAPAAVAGGAESHQASTTDDEESSNQSEKEKAQDEEKQPHASFRDLKILQNAQLWETVDAHPLELSLALKERYVPQGQKGGFTRDVAETLVQILQLWHEQPDDVMVPQRGIDLLERIALWTAGASANDIEKFTRQLNANEMSERYRKPWNAAEQKVRQTESKTYGQNPKSTGKLPKHIWSKLSAEARREITNMRK